MIVGALSRNDKGELAVHSFSRNAVANRLTAEPTHEWQDIINTDVRVIECKL
jgi:hypothetical protein